jgi:hypothetical protein
MEAGTNRRSGERPPRSSGPSPPARPGSLRVRPGSVRSADAPVYASLVSPPPWAGASSRRPWPARTDRPVSLFLGDPSRYSSERGAGRDQRRPPDPRPPRRGRQPTVLRRRYPARRRRTGGRRCWRGRGHPLRPPRQRDELVATYPAPPQRPVCGRRPRVSSIGWIGVGNDGPRPLAVFDVLTGSAVSRTEPRDLRHPATHSRQPCRTEGHPEWEPRLLPG